MSACALQHQLFNLQTDNGCFPALVCQRDKFIVDFSGFATVLVLRAIRNHPADSLQQTLCNRALNFIQQCQSSKIAGAYGFWPEGTSPAWANNLPPDIDDTSTMLLELLRHDRLCAMQAKRMVCSIFVSNRISGVERAVWPEWIANGAFQTWIINSRRSQNIVDCTVNANALALLSYLKLADLPGYREAVDTIVNGLAWAGEDLRKLLSLTPFYSNLHEFSRALHHAMECGAGELTDASIELDKQIESHNLGDDGIYCTSAYGEVRWKSPAVVIANRLAKSKSAGCTTRRSSLPLTTGR